LLGKISKRRTCFDGMSQLDGVRTGIKSAALRVQSRLRFSLVPMVSFVVKSFHRLKQEGKNVHGEISKVMVVLDTHKISGLGVKYSL